MYEIKYRKSEEMKDSGVEWLGEIPKDWKISKLKYYCEVKDGTHDTPEYVDEAKNTYPLITSKNIINNSIDFTQAKHISSEDYILINKRSDVTFNDVIMPMIGTIGNPAIVETHKKFSIKNVALFKTNKSLPKAKFLKYLIDSYIIQEQFNLLNRGGVQNFLSLSILKNLHIIDPVNSLNKVVDFLNTKTSEFDSIISKKEKLIEKLEEAKKSLISEVVTGKVKIVDGELVKRELEEMKDIINTFFDKVPKGWKVSKLKYVTNQIIDGTHFTPNYTDAGIPFLRVTDITKSKYNEIDLDNVMYISPKEHKELIKRCKPKKGDLLVSKNGTIGKPMVVNWDWEFSIFVSLCLIKLTNTLNSNLLAYFFKSGLLDKQIAYGGKTTSITNLHLDKIREFFVAIPNENEQLKLVNYLDKKVWDLDKTIEKNNNQIQNLKQAKQSLISEAVTGKIDLRDWEIIEEGEE